MANSRLIFAKPTDNKSPVSNGGGTAWVVNTGTEDTTYPAANLGKSTPNPAKPAKLTTTTGSWVRDFGSAMSIDLVALIHHNLTAGLEVRVQANATNSWATPSLNQTFTIDAYMVDGFPFCPWIDLTSLTRNFRYWRIVVVGVNANPVAIGEVMLIATKRQMAVNISWGLETEDEQLGVQHRTSYGVVTSFPFAVKQRRITGEVETTDTGRSELEDWHRSAKGMDQPSMIVLDPNVNDAMLVRWMDDKLTARREFKNSNFVRLAWEEVSRGMVL